MGEETRFCKDVFNDLLIDYGCVRLYDEPERPYYVDLSDLVSDKVDLLTDQVHAFTVYKNLAFECDYYFPVYGGNAESLAIELSKRYGKRAPMLSGGPNEGGIVVPVTTAVTTGKSLHTSIGFILRGKGDVLYALSLVDRRERPHVEIIPEDMSPLSGGWYLSASDLIRKKYGINVYSLIDTHSLLNRLKERGMLSEDQEIMVVAYYSKHGCDIKVEQRTQFGVKEGENKLELVLSGRMPA